MNETTTETVQPALFPLSALQSDGYAQPEARDDEAVAAQVDDEADAA